MDFNLTPEHLELKHHVTELARAMPEVDMRDRDSRGDFSHEAWRALGVGGVLGLNVPREHGGSGADALTTALALEALGYACSDNGLTFAVAAQLTSVQPTLVDFGSEDQRRRYLPGLIAGDRIGCYAMSEEASGSDAYALRTMAERRGDHYVLNGEKWFITFGPIADFALVYATTAPKAGQWGVSLFIVDLDAPGVSRSPVQDKMGLRTVPMGKLIFQECEVPAGHLIGREGAGASIFNHSQEWERACILAGQLGMMARQIEECVRFARERHAFGQPIGKFQAISSRIAEMKLRLETARLLTYRAAWLKAAGQPAMLDAALANLHTGECYVQNSLDAVRIHGARGYLAEYDVERALRDAIGGPIYGGTSDIQRNIIARLMGL